MKLQVEIIIDEKRLREKIYDEFIFLSNNWVDEILKEVKRKVHDEIYSDARINEIGNKLQKEIIARVRRGEI